MRRREFIAGLGGAVALPLTARSQQGERVRRIGWLTGYDENDPFAKLEISTLTQALASLGWTDGRNVRMDFRWAGGDINRMRALAQELSGVGIEHDRGPLDAGRDLREQLKILASQRSFIKGKAGDIPPPAG